LASRQGLESLSIELNIAMNTCSHCQTLFRPARTNKKKPKKYCSLACVREAKQSKKEPQNCVYCGTLTLNPKFCSSSCAASYNNTIVPKRKKQYRICPTCGIEHRRIKFCSDECNPRKLKLTSEEKYFYTRAKKNEAWQRYMAKRKNQTPKDADIFAMQQFYLNCPNGYEVDHIIPISKGGLHSIENLQYLTVSENRKKSNKL
jgi:5-methylcytosine-specific restriction endonuclease McrA